MVTRFVSLFALVVVLHGAASAQVESENTPATVGQLNQLRNEIKADIRTAIAEALRPAAAPQNDGLVPVKPPETLEERVAGLEQGQSRLAGDVGDLRTALGEIAMSDEGGRRYVRFDTNSQPAREELRRAIKSTAPEKGQFIIRNRTPWQQRLIVNGYEQQIQPYGELNVPVNPGAVMSWLPGEQKLTWHVGMPDFKQVVELHPRQPSYVARWVGY
jgi:hypothetical protein